jgi:hypothetical protein
LEKKEEKKKRERTAQTHLKFFAGEYKWTLEKPLRVEAISHRSSCKTCQEAIQETLSLHRIAAVVDVYRTEPTSGGYSKMKRFMFSILKSRRDHLADRYYLVEGGFHFINQTHIEGTKKKKKKKRKQKKETRNSFDTFFFLFERLHSKVVAGNDEFGRNRTKNQ